MGKKYRIGNVSLFVENKDYSSRFTWVTPKWPERSRNWWNMLILTNQLHLCITKTWVFLTFNVSVNQAKSLSMDTEQCVNHEFLLEQLKGWDQNCPDSVVSHGPNGQGRGVTLKMQWPFSNENLYGQPICKQKDTETVQSFKSFLG